MARPGKSPRKDSGPIGVVWTTVKQWESWLAEHHQQASELWLRIAKKGSAKRSITISEALDGALCYGWIDGQRKSCDADYYLQRYTPRRPKSAWSRINVARVAALMAARRMRQPGRAAIAAAQADGRWAVAYVSQRKAAVPADLTRALKRKRQARIAFEELGKTARYTITLPLLKATTPVIRQARLQQLVARLAATKSR